MANKHVKDSAFVASNGPKGHVAPRMGHGSSVAAPANASNSAKPGNKGGLSVLRKVSASPGFKTGLSKL